MLPIRSSITRWLTLLRSTPVVVSGNLLAIILAITGQTLSVAPLIFTGALITLSLFSLTYVLDVKRHIIALLFNLSLFIFYLGRYLVRFIDNVPMDAGEKYTTTALGLVFISILTVNTVYLLLNRGTKSANKAFRLSEIAHQSSRLNLFTNIGLIVTGLCAGILNLATYFYALTNGYTALYTGADYGLPTIITTLGNMFIFFVALKLAFMPSKRVAYTVLATYVTLLLPHLLAGKRMGILIALLLWVTYIILRARAQAGKDKTAWFGRTEKTFVAIMIPLIILFVPLFGSLRGGDTINDNPLRNMLDSQGVTLEVISYGIQFQDQTPQSVYGPYSFAPLVDYLSTNFISRAIFGTEEVPTQTEEAAEKGKSYADVISSMVLWKSLYLSGQGLGSAYIIENFIDFGVIGVVLFSTIIALLINWAGRNFGRSGLRSFISIMLIINLYALPRNTSTEFLVAMIQIQAILLVLFIFIYDKLINDLKGDVR